MEASLPFLTEGSVSVLVGPWILQDSFVTECMSRRLVSGIGIARRLELGSLLLARE